MSKAMQLVCGRDSHVGNLTLKLLFLTAMQYHFSVYKVTVLLEEHVRNTKKKLNKMK